MKELDSHELMREIEICNLQDENKKLKEQLSGTTFCYDEEEHRRLKDKIVELERTIELSHANAKETLGEINYEQEAQQKEFIKYLEDEINWCIMQGDIFSIDMMGAFILSLDKYKEIIGVLDEKES